ncbi:MAG: LpxI family protein [Candidatus Gastranaerophilales bacterium]|nr:LpxI family protein [Candidatus Gastranaerophilales bacterium]
MGNIEPTEEQKIDIEYGFSIAKEMGRLDIGQSVVVQNKMILAIEAIEGTDEAIKRGCKFGKKGAVVVKVSKPEQDKRFDIPTVGLNTIKTMHKTGAKVLAIEAGKTFIVEKDEVVKFADKHNMVIVAV